MKCGLLIKIVNLSKFKIMPFDTSYWADIIKMRYSTQPKFRKYVKGYGSLSFARKFLDKYGKKLMDTATKQE